MQLGNAHLHVALIMWDIRCRIDKILFATGPCLGWHAVQGRLPMLIPRAINGLPHVDSRQSKKRDVNAL
jgi:hypothetical protein